MIKNVLQYFEEGALKSNPNGIAVQDDERKITFSELSDQARALGTLIARRYGSQNMPIAVFLPKCVDVVIIDLAILYSGNFYTNIDDRTPIERLEKLLLNVEPVLIITNQRTQLFLDSLSLPRIASLPINELMLISVECDPSLLADIRKKIIDTDPVCLINTSGSTGTPKSVALSHRGTFDFINWCFETFHFDHRDRIGSLSPFHFDIYTLELFVALNIGASIFLIPDSIAAFPASIVEFLNTHQISFIFWVPTIMVNIANLGLVESAPPLSLRRVFFAGEVFPTKQLNMWRRALPQTQFVNLYGPIEIHVDCTYFIVDRPFADDEPIPIGIPCDNTEILILGGDNAEVSQGETGELCVRGSSLGLGYYNNQELTSRVFCQNPLNTRYQDLIYRTGDLAYRNELGEIMFAGRKDFQIKHSGYRIELGEIETAVTALEEIRNACVVYDLAKKQIVLFFESSVNLTPSDLRLKLQPTLPKYMIPTRFLQLDELPRNPNGKIDRKQLADSLPLNLS